MSLLTIINGVQTINAAISGVTKAPAVAAYPGSLNPGVDCPFAFTWPRAGEWDEAAIGLDQDVETLVISVLVAPVGSGIRGDVVATAITLLEAFRVAWIAAANQDIGDTVEQITSASHGGLQTLIYAGVEFYGFQVTLATLLKEIP